MQITPETPRVQRNVHSVTVQVPRPYKAGSHTLTEGEAHALNQTFWENVRNNQSKVIEENKGDPKKVQEILDAAFAEYEFGVSRGGGGAPRDPVRSEALRLAKDKLKEKLRKENKEIPSAESLNEMANKLVDGDPAWINVAQQILNNRRSLGNKLTA